MIMVNLNCFIYCLSALFIKQCIAMQVHNEQLENKQFVSGPDNEINLANKYDGSNAESAAVGLVEDVQDEMFPDADYAFPPFVRNTRDLRSRFRVREKYGGDYAPYIKYSPLKRKLKAGEIVKLLERIAERRGIQISNKALRYGISRRSID